MTNVRPFRFGVAVESAPSREAWIELVRRVEDMGYATFLLADHYVNEFPPLAALMQRLPVRAFLMEQSSLF